VLARAGRVAGLLAILGFAKLELLRSGTSMGAACMAFGFND
jgi:hypothetical protein